VLAAITGFLLDEETDCVDQGSERILMEAVSLANQKPDLGATVASSDFRAYNQAAVVGILNQSRRKGKR
jgi:hypothetical protein